MMLGKALPLKTGCYAYQWLGIMICIRMQLLIKIYHAIQELWTFSITDHGWTDSHSVYSAHLLCHLQGAANA